MGKLTSNHPLQITITSLFMLVIVVLGGVLTLQNYSKTSEIILNSADKLYSQISRELLLDFKVTYAPLAGTLQLISQSPITQSVTLEERLQYVKRVHTVLANNSSIYSTGVAFPDGDAFIVSLLDDELKRTHFRAPDDAILKHYTHEL